MPPPQKKKKIAKTWWSHKKNNTTSILENFKSENRRTDIGLTIRKFSVRTWEGHLVSTFILHPALLKTNSNHSLVNSCFKYAICPPPPPPPPPPKKIAKTWWSHFLTYEHTHTYTKTLFKIWHYTEIKHTKNSLEKSYKLKIKSFLYFLIIFTTQVHFSYSEKHTLTCLLDWSKLWRMFLAKSTSDFAQNSLASSNWSCSSVKPKSLLPLLVLCFSFRIWIALSAAYTEVSSLFDGNDRLTNLILTHNLTKHL